MKLRTIGYYKEMPHGQETDPCMKEFINQENPKQVDLICNYLRNGSAIIVSPGATIDVFCPEIISTTFIYYLLKSRFFISFIAARTEGSVIPHLYQKDFMEFEFPLPPSDKMAEFEELTEPMFSQIVNNLNENKKLAALRDNLLPKLMSGELDVFDLDF